MERTQQLPKIRDAAKESMFGYVYAVSGPGAWRGQGGREGGGGGGWAM